MDYSFALKLFKEKKFRSLSHAIEKPLARLKAEYEKREGYYQKYANRGVTYQYSNRINRKTALTSIKKNDAQTVPVIKKIGFFPYEAM